MAIGAGLMNEDGDWLLMLMTVCASHGHNEFIAWPRMLQHHTITNTRERVAYCRCMASAKSTSIRNSI